MLEFYYFFLELSNHSQFPKDETGAEVDLDVYRGSWFERAEEKSSWIDSEKPLPINGTFQLKTRIFTRSDSLLQKSNNQRGPHVISGCYLLLLLYFWAIVTTVIDL